MCIAQPPRIIQQPQNAHVTEGDEDSSVQFVIKAKGIGLAFKWKKLDGDVTLPQAAEEGKLCQQ